MGTQQGVTTMDVFPPEQAEGLESCMRRTLIPVLEAQTSSSVVEENQFSDNHTTVLIPAPLLATAVCHTLHA